MNTYTVLYRNNGIGPLEQPFGFKCQADNVDHAEEQCLDAEPDADIVWVAATDNYTNALQDYWYWEEA